MHNDNTSVLTKKLAEIRYPDQDETKLTCGGGGAWPGVRAGLLVMSARGVRGLPLCTAALGWLPRALGPLEGALA